MERLEREAAGEPNEHMRIAFHEQLALWNARLKGSAAAATIREHVAAGQACAEVAGCPRCTAQLHLVSAEALASIGDRATARHMLARWDDRGVHPVDFDALARLRAGALASEEPAARVAGLKAAVAAAENSPYRLEALWGRLELGLALAPVSKDHAIEELTQTATVASELGAATVLDLSQKALRSLGVRTWRRGRAQVGEGLEALTVREREVALLIAAGATNPEIARSLFLSRKTIERHVSNVMAKLGARNRAELAARLARTEDPIS